ncbi:MAG TPA: caspase family protein, partial [Pirellulales bacterium]
KSLLRERLQFDEQQIEVLAGWPEDDESRRPTKANIERAFVALTDRVSAGSSVFIFLSGHGDQRPVSPSQTDLLDPKNVEPDSLDEVFIAADYAGDDKFIRDDQIGRWLDDLTNKGAHVWIVFDACHSATLTRDGGSPDETPRRLAASRSTVEEAAFAAAVQRAESLPEALRDPFAPPVESLTRPRAQGSVTAFYACQPFETAKELYRPRGAERTAANRRGLFSFHLEEALRAGLPRTLTYRELSHQLVARLRADLGGHAPTPYFDGDLDREVLGFASWPAPAIRLEPAIASDPAEQRRVSGGTLHGVAPEAILAVYAPNDREYQREIARARVLSVAPTSAIVEPWPGAATSPEADATARAALPSEGTCRIVERGWSEPKLRIAVAGRTREPSEAADALAPVVERLRGSLGEVVEFVNDDADSIDFTLAKLTPDVNRVGSAQAGERLRLTPGRFDPHAASVDSTTATYPALEPTALASCVEKDLQKILTWRRFWRLVEAT